MDAITTIPPPPLSFETHSPSKTPTKNRSFSDPPNNTTPGTLAPSPTFHERLHLSSKDDNDAAPLTPKATRRPDFISRGLSLQMPSPSHFPRPAPLSPKLDQNTHVEAGSLGSPVASLPRHSRGLDFSRACTNLHHSTLAESSPDSSPVITQRGLMMMQGMMIPRQRSRKGSMSSMALDSPNINGGGSILWGSLGGVPHQHSQMSSSVGSVNMMMGSESSSDGSGDEDASMGGDENDDAIFTTPQVHKLQNPNAAATPFPSTFAPPTTPGGGTNLWGSGSHFSPAQASLMRTMKRTKMQKSTGQRRSKRSSSSASGSGYSSMASPRTTSPPPMRSIETAASNGGYFNWTTAARSRRESLAMGTDGLHTSSGNDSGDEGSPANTMPSTPGVVRRAVTRRGNLLPKTKGFARIRAALLEEAAPIDSEVRREAETIRQVRERDGSIADLELPSTENSRPQTATAQSSPTLLPAVPESEQEDFGKDLNDDTPIKNVGLGMNFASHASRNSGGMDYWHRFATPPPGPPGFNKQSSSIISSDMNIDSSDPAAFGTTTPARPRARSSASDASQTQTQLPVSSSGAMNDDMHLAKFRSKRRREDDFDIATIKRRAVSPGMSAQNSPVLTQSPSQREIAGGGGAWGQPPERKEKQGSGSQSQPLSAVSEGSTQGSTQGSVAGAVSRQGSSGSLGQTLSNGGPGPGTPGGPGGGKKLGLQGMVDTNDGLMKMSIE